jgi:mono/diheme cytochrome c family protein
VLTQEFLTVLLGLAFATVITNSHAQGSAVAGQCPQPRFTGKAPADYLDRINPLSATPENLRAGQRLFSGTENQEACSLCHGKNGDGKGALAKLYDPPPRNFACAQTVVGVPDGQLFWIIRFGSPNTAMPPHSRLSDEQIWQLLLYLRQLAK